jgi:hypothetical protein
MYQLDLSLDIDGHMDNKGKTIGDESPWNPYVQDLGWVTENAFFA